MSRTKAHESAERQFAAALVLYEAALRSNDGTADKAAAFTSTARYMNAVCTYAVNRGQRRDFDKRIEAAAQRIRQEKEAVAA